MNIYRLYGAMDLRKETKETPIPGPGEVQIRTAYVGVCGSDLPHLLRGEGVAKFPSTLGHEFSAVVTAVGEGITSLVPGDHVVVAPRLTCGKCVHCRNGNPGQCVEGRFFGLAVEDLGGFAEYNVLPERNLVKIPADMDMAQAAMVEPITVGLHALSLMKFDPEKPVAIVGLGTIGMLLLQSIFGLGAKTVYAFDIDPKKLEKAEKFGAKCYNTGDPDCEEKFMADTDGYGAPQVLEVVGIQKTIMFSLHIASVMADVALIGDVWEPITFPVFEYRRLVGFHQLHLHGVYQSYTDGFPGKEFGRAIDLIGKNKYDLKNMIASLDSMDNVMKYMEEIKNGAPVSGKLLFRFPEE